MKKALVSIIVPCYNQAQYLNEALESLLNQTYENWECIIVNDGSTDDTEEIAKQWTEIDSRFKYVVQDNRGLSSARNLGISQAKGEFILPLDADDKIMKNYTTGAIEAFENDFSLKIVYCKAEKFGEETGNWILPSFSLATLARENMIFCTAFFKKSDWVLVGGYDVNMIYGLEDWELWISILKGGGGVKCLEEIYFLYRTKPDSMIKRLDDKKRKEVFEYLSIKHVDFFVNQFGSFLHINSLTNKVKKDYENKFKSKKFVIDLFCETFLNFSIFGLYKKK
jgi:glycosyltransferase involved in cell wall biosynthesis